MPQADERRRPAGPQPAKQRRGFYKLSKMLARFSLRNPFERLWQKGLPSPHVHYFNRKNLERLITRHDFVVKSEGEVPTLSLQGLHARISYTGGMGRISGTFVYLAVAASLPLLKVLDRYLLQHLSTQVIVVWLGRTPCNGVHLKQGTESVDIHAILLGLSNNDVRLTNMFQDAMFPPQRGRKPAVF